MFSGTTGCFQTIGYKLQAGLAATLLGGAIIGVIPAIACSTAEPQSHTYNA